MQLLIPLWWQTYYSYQLIKVNFRFSKTITVEYFFNPLLCVNRVFSRARPCGISAIWKKNAAYNLRCRVKWGPKNRPKDKYFFFEIKYSKTSLTTTLIRRPLYKLFLNFYSLLLSQLPFSSSFESLFHQTNIRDSAVIRAQALSLAQNVPKWRKWWSQVLLYMKCLIMLWPFFRELLEIWVIQDLKETSGPL